MAKLTKVRWRELRVADNDKLVRELLEAKNKGRRNKVFDGDAHALLMYVYKDPARDLALRIDCAKAAISYEKPKLSPVQVKDGEEGQTEQSIKIEFVSPNQVAAVKMNGGGNGTAH